MTSQNSLRILLIEDNRCDARLLKEHLAEAGASRVQVTQVDRLATAIELVAGQKPDVVLLDLSLPDSHGLETLTRMHAAANGVPIVVLTSVEDEALGLRLIQAGAQDYLVKGQVTGALLTRALRYAVERKRMEAALKQSERTLRAQARLLRSILCSMGEGVVVVDEAGIPVMFNPAAERILVIPPAGVSSAEWIQRMDALCPDMASPSRSADLPLLQVFRGDEVNNVELFIRRTGSARGSWLTVSTRRLQGDDRTARGSVVVFHDITHHKLVEAELRDSEHRLRSLIESAQDIIFTIFKDAIITSLNPAFERLTGWSCGQWMGKPFGDLLHPDDLLFTADLVAHTVTEREVLTTALHMRRKEGGYLTVETTLVPHVNGGRVVGVMGIARDVSERKRAEEALRDHAERLRSIVESTKDAIVSLDHEGKVSFWNKGAEDMFGYSMQEIVGRPVTRIIPERFREAHELGIKRAVAAGRLTVTGNMFELFGLRKDGTEFPLELTLAAWHAKSGLFFTGILRDITERKRAEAEREKLLNDRLLLLESTGEGIYGLDLQGRCTFINKAGAKMLGYQPEELVGKNMHALIHHHQVW
ncbi:MAG: PAS domain S-box protein [Nitrospirota bacterium]